MTIEEAIKNREKCLNYLEGLGALATPESVEAVRWSVKTLREYQARSENSSLIVDQLREMTGEPVWCEELQCWGIIKCASAGRWANIPFLVGVWRHPQYGSAVNFEYNI